MSLIEVSMSKSKQASTGKSTKKGVPKEKHKKVVKSHIPESLDSEKIKQGIINPKLENRYDKIFETKLAEQYKEFRQLKEHSMQMKKFIRVLMIIITIILITVLLLTFN
jgi:hypothetical protein